MRFFRRLQRDASGATAIEYSLIATILGIALLAALTNVSEGVGEKFNSIANATK